MNSFPGVTDFIIGWSFTSKCLVACLFFELSQQPTCPHDRHIRSATQLSPVTMQSSHTVSSFAVTSLISSRWLHSRCVISSKYSKKHPKLFGRFSLHKWLLNQCSDFVRSEHTHRSRLSSVLCSKECCAILSADREN